jgi:hypothetical protein
VFERNAGRAPVPPRTVNVTNVTNVTNVNVTNVTNVNNITNVNSVVGNTKNVVAAQGQKSVALDKTARAEVHKTSMAAQQTLAADRRKLEATPVSGPTTAPRTTALTVPKTPAFGSGGTTKGATLPPLTKTDSGKSVHPLDGKGSFTPPPDLKGSKTPPPDVKGNPPVVQPPRDSKTEVRPVDSSKKNPPPPPEKKKKT